MLRLEHFNADRGELYCIRQKGSNNNTIRLDEIRIKLLKRYIREYNPQDTLFLSKQNNPISVRMLQVLMNHYAKVAKILKDKRHYHTLKHSCAVHLADSGLDVKSVQYWLGHKSVINTQVYMFFTTQQQGTMYEQLEAHSTMVE